MPCTQNSVRDHVGQGGDWNGAWLGNQRVCACMHVRTECAVSHRVCNFSQSVQFLSTRCRSIPVRTELIYAVSVPFSTSRTSVQAVRRALYRLSSLTSQGVIASLPHNTMTHHYHTHHGDSSLTSQGVIAHPVLRVVPVQLDRVVIGGGSLQGRTDGRRNRGARHHRHNHNHHQYYTEMSAGQQGECTGSKVI